MARPRGGYGPSLGLLVSRDAWLALEAAATPSRAALALPSGSHRGKPSASASAAGILLAARPVITIIFGGAPRVSAATLAGTSSLTIVVCPMSWAWSWVPAGRRRRSGAIWSASLDCDPMCPWRPRLTRRSVGLPRARLALRVVLVVSVVVVATSRGSLGRGIGFPRIPPTAAPRSWLEPRAPTCIHLRRLPRAVPQTPRARPPTGSPARPGVPPHDFPPGPMLVAAGRSPTHRSGRGPLAVASVVRAGDGTPTNTTVWAGGGRRRR